MTQYPSYRRFYWGVTGVGMGCGIAWTQALFSDFAQRHIITHRRAEIALYSCVALCFAAQAWMLYRWDKQLKANREEIRQNLIALRERYPDHPWDDVTRTL